MECEIQLIKLDIVLYEATIDLEDYNPVLALATENKTHVFIDVYHARINFNENLLEENARNVWIYASTW